MKRILGTRLPFLKNDKACPARCTKPLGDWTRQRVWQRIENSKARSRRKELLLRNNRQTSSCSRKADRSGLWSGLVPGQSGTASLSDTLGGETKKIRVLEVWKDESEEEIRSESANARCKSRNRSWPDLSNSTKAELRAWSELGKRAKSHSGRCDKFMERCTEWKLATLLITQLHLCFDYEVIVIYK